MSDWKWTNWKRETEIFKIYKKHSFRVSKCRPLQSIFISFLAYNLIYSSLQVTCAFDEKGCTAIIRYEDLEKHEFECQFNIIICECGVTMQASLKKVIDKF